MPVTDQEEEPAAQAGENEQELAAPDGGGEPDAQAGNTVDGAAASSPEGEFDERRAKMERLRAEGIDPYPPVTLWDTRTRIADVLAAHDPDELEEGGHPELRYQVAGRLISRREHPNTSFLDLRDLSGSIQIVVRLDDLGEGTYKHIM